MTVAANKAAMVSFEYDMGLECFALSAGGVLRDNRTWPTDRRDLEKPAVFESAGQIEGS
jgi:hypothetical protein